MPNKNKIFNILENFGIDLYGFVPFSACVPANRRLYDECRNIGIKTAVIFAVPYKTDQTHGDGYNMSAYARVYDYHKKFTSLFDIIIPRLNESFPDNTFNAFADHSPINEKLAASSAGLGVIGNNTLLITKKYGSFVFLGGIYTDLDIPCDVISPERCLDCGLCKYACPTGAIGEKSYDHTKCLSYISQKNAKTECEKVLLYKTKTVWGCDICQNVCPLNDKAQNTADSYFTGSFIKNLSYDFIEKMDNSEFLKYPFSWRKKQVILDNIANADKNNFHND
ncbi:MAG: epoxyqueuosine reductase [Eubacteriales bacterium]|jgi:epoxyqueuosine reductase QueG